MKTTRQTTLSVPAGWMLMAAALTWATTCAPASADPAFQYDPLTAPIVSASLSVDFAALQAHRYIGETEVNFVQLVDVTGGLGELDLSDDMFGTATWPEPPQVDMGVLETGWVSADIDASFYPALTAGSLGLKALLTDTNDAMFAIDCLILSIELEGDEFVNAYYGWPVGNENDGFGIDLADGGDLPDVLPDSLPSGTTGTGFDETISSKSILAIPEPTALALLGLGVLLSRRRRL